MAVLNSTEIAAAGGQILQPWTYACIGDSRTAQGGGSAIGGGIFTDLRYFPNFANALLGHRMRCVGNWGVPGDRTDQFLVRMPLVLAAKPRMVIIWGGVNDIAQGITGLAAYANIKTAARMALDAGCLVVLVTEAGSSNFTATQIRRTGDLNAKLRALANEWPNTILFDEANVVRAPTTSTITFRAGTMANETPLTHRSQNGGYLAGKEFAKILQTFVPPVNILPYSILERRNDSNYDIQDYPLFNTPTGGTAGSGFTGSIPMGFASARLGTGATAVLSSAANVNGFGNDVSIAAAGGLREGGYLNDWGSQGSRVSPGDVLEALVEVDISSPVNFQGISVAIDMSVDGVARSYADGYHQASSAATELLGPTENHSLVLCTPQVVVPASYTTMNYLLSRVQWQFNAASGSATIKLRRWGFRKVPQI